MRLLWFVSTLEDTNFLKEFRKSCEFAIDVFNINFITRFSLLGHNGEHILPKFSSDYEQHSVEENLEKVFNVLSGRLNLSDADKAYKATKAQLASYIKSIHNEKVVFIIPSGRHVHHVAATNFAKERRLERVYINYSNFPGYTFFDPEGTDCAASIFKDPTKLNRLYNKREINIDETFKNFSELKKQQKNIPQKASNGLKNKIKSGAFIIDTILQKTTNVIGDRRVGAGVKTKNDVEQISYSTIDLSKPFLFFPLQVSTDQQILVNYDGGCIYKAIEQAYEYSKLKALPLYVREHPAESNKSEVRAYLKKMALKDDFFVTDASVSVLLTKCEEVITVNSTVGLEARINRKPVHFLGKSFYEKATDLQLAYYLKFYLVAVDYHQAILRETHCKEILNFAIKEQ